MKTIEELEKDKKHYQGCLTGSFVDEYVYLQIETIQNNINYILYKEKFEKKKD